MKRFVLFVLMVLICHTTHCQLTKFENSSWTSGANGQSTRLYSINVLDGGVEVTFELKAQKALRWMGIKHTSNTYIVYNNVKLLQVTGDETNGQIITNFYNRGWENVPFGETRRYTLYFKGHLPSYATNISIIDYGNSNGRGPNFTNWNIKVNRKNYLQFNSESAIKAYIDQNKDGICGMYEYGGEGGANLACVKDNGEYYLIYVSSPPNYNGRYFWEIGDIKAKLKQTASGIFKAEWYSTDHLSTLTQFVVFDGISMLVCNSDFNPNSESIYLLSYPLEPSTRSTVGSPNSVKWTGTGFALNNGYIVTNNHVVDGASSLTITGVNGSNIEYKAEVVATDSKNDLALIRINDSRFSSFGTIPYSIKSTMSDVGENVFVLGYPLTYYMGDEIKLTNGIISSRSGYQGDITTYQISAPIQPGNSGGPAFDDNGNVIGIVNASIPDAENVGYAIKTSYLYTLVSSVASTSIIPNNNTLSGKSLSEKVKQLRNFVFFIKCY